MVWFVTWAGFSAPLAQPLTGLVTIGFAGLALLMVSPIPYPSLKIIRLDRGSYPTLVALVLLSVGLLLAHDWLFFVLGLVFTLSGPVSWIHRWRTGAELVPSLEPPAEQIDV